MPDSDTPMRDLLLTEEQLLNLHVRAPEGYFVLEAVDDQHIRTAYGIVGWLREMKEGHAAKLLERQLEAERFGPPEALEAD